ncbi:MAG: hypothetical protein ACO1RA_10720 [Planctomycetaceae bacterium]
MKKTFRRFWIPVVLATAGALTCFPAGSTAAPPWGTLIPLRKVDADPNKSYDLTEQNGPWLIMCASFAGPQAEEQAQNLVVELRKNLKIEAFTYKQHFDFTRPEEGLGYDRFGGKKKMKYRNGTKFDEIAVLAGGYSSVDQPELEKMLKTIKYYKSETIDPAKNKESNQQLARLRSVYRAFHEPDVKKAKGPLGSAFVTRNPLLPEEYFAPKGLDPFVVELNKDLEYSLLNNKGVYTVRVASFRGVDTMKPNEFEELTNNRNGAMAKLDQAALKASKMTKALREQGVEAYEFHDRTESIVTIGSFNSVGEPRADGKTEINPAVHRIMQSYGPITKAMPGKTQMAVEPRMLQGIPFEPQPLPVRVPKISIANSLAKSAGE